VDARSVRHPCRHRACVAWAVSAWCAVEPGVMRRSDRRCGPRYKKESRFLMAAIA
jgi:hypothetical protein